MHAYSQEINLNVNEIPFKPLIAHASVHQVCLFLMKKYYLPVIKIVAFPILLFAILLVIFSSTRLGLLSYVGTKTIPLELWRSILIRGLWFDIVVAGVLLAPVLLYETFLPNKWRSSQWHHTLRLVWLWISIALLLFGVIAEITFWLEFSTRFNFIAIDYLIYTHEVIGNIRESYPVNTILLSISVIAAIVVILIQKK